MGISTLAHFISTQHDDEIERTQVVLIRGFERRLKMCMPTNLSILTTLDPDNVG